MNIKITQWALDSYLNLVSQRAFSRQEFLTKIKPDVMLLKEFPNNVNFLNGKFWSWIHDIDRKVIANGYKMKWHQIGDGKVQLRLTVGIFGMDCFLCEAYVKKDEKTDKRKLAKFKAYLGLMQKRHFIMRGELT